jgi:hypothetical protein
MERRRERLWELPDYREAVERVRNHGVRALYERQTPPPLYELPTPEARLEEIFTRILQPAGLPDGPERNTFVKVCSGCHPPEVVLGRMDTPKNWVRKVAR